MKAQFSIFVIICNDEEAINPPNVKKMEKYEIKCKQIYALECSQNNVIFHKKRKLDIE